MKIPRRKPEPPSSEPTIWEKLTDFISDSGNWEKAEPGQHSHGIDIYDPGHSHGVWTQEMIDAEVRRVIAKEYTISRKASAILQAACLLAKFK